MKVKVKNWVIMKTGQDVDSIWDFIEFLKECEIELIEIGKGFRDTEELYEINITLTYNDFITLLETLYGMEDIKSFLNNEDLYLNDGGDLFETIEFTK